MFIDAELRQVEAAARIGARVCEIHTGPYAHAFHAQGPRSAKARRWSPSSAKIRAAGEAIRALGMRFNAGHALNYFNVQPVAALPGVRELHIGHAIVSRAVFVGMREAVREMKALMREAARAALARANRERRRACRAARSSLGIEGCALTAADRERLAHPLAGGVILFARNFESPRAARRR